MDRREEMKKTAAYLRDKKAHRQRITMLTCYDYPTALWEEQADVDVIFVGDSVGTNVLGYESEKQVTLDDMLHHLRAVRRGVSTAYLLVDLPYGTYGDAAAALDTAKVLLNAGADGVKLEGFRSEIVSHLVGHGVEVCTHLGLNPQIHDERTLQAKTATAAMQLLDESLGLQEAGAFMMVYELIPEEVAREATGRLAIPTVGIGAGRFTDGQVLIVSDMLGANAFELRHSRKYETFRERGIDAVTQYVAHVRSGHFPQAENVRHLSTAEAERFAEHIQKHAYHRKGRGRYECRHPRIADAR